LVLAASPLSTHSFKEGGAQNQDNMSEWGHMSIHGLLFQWASTIIQLSVSI
jgi:hypothetical protein